MGASQCLNSLQFFHFVTKFLEQLHETSLPRTFSLSIKRNITLLLGCEYNLFHCTCTFATKTVRFQECIESSSINSKRTDWIYLLQYSELKRLFRKLLSSSIFCLCATTSCIIEDLGPLFQCKIVQVASTKTLNKNLRNSNSDFSFKRVIFSESQFVTRYFNLRSRPS